MFSEVMGSTRRAGELLEVPLPKSDEARNENQTVRKMANRGRQLLRECFDDAEWRVKVERMRGYREWWEWYESLVDPKEQVYALLAKARGTSAEHERALAEEDGFDATLKEWGTIAERHLNVHEAFGASNDHAELDNLSREGARLLHLQESIEERDKRFVEAFSVFGTPPTDRA